MTRHRAVGGSAPSGSYSPGIVAGPLVFVSGQGPLRGGEVVAGDAAAQVRLTLDNVVAVLAEAGASLSDVVRVGVYLQDLADFDAMDAVYREYFADPMPARTTVGAGLVDILVEIDCIALAPGADA